MDMMQIRFYRRIFYGVYIEQYTWSARFSSLLFQDSHSNAASIRCKHAMNSFFFFFVSFDFEVSTAQCHKERALGDKGSRSPVDGVYTHALTLCFLTPTNAPKMTAFPLYRIFKHTFVATPSILLGCGPTSRRASSDIDRLFPCPLSRHKSRPAGPARACSSRPRRPRQCP